MLTNSDLQKIKMLFDKSRIQKEHVKKEEFDRNKELIEIKKELKIIKKNLKNSATKDDLEKLAKKTDSDKFSIREDLESLKQDLKQFAKKDDLESLKQDLKQFAKKEDLEKFATKDDLKDFAKKEDLNKAVEEIIEFIGILGDKLKEDVSEIKEILVDHQKKIDNHEIRIKNLEVN